MKDTKTPFCKVPFTIGFTTINNLYRDCCGKKPYIVSKQNQTFDQWWTSKELNEFKQKLLESDEWPDECWSCQVREQDSNHSYRTAVNHWAVDDYTYPCAWNIEFGNICNLGCWSCNEESSSVIFEHKKQAGLLSGNNTSDIKFREHWPKLYLNILKSYNYHETVTITILGGEPLYSPLVKEFLNNLIEKNLAHRTKLEFHTNGTVYPDKVLSTNNKSPWKHVCTFISLDAIGPYAEWLRYGCKWNKVNNTVDSLIIISDYVEIHCTLTVLNINQLHGLEEYAKQKNCKLCISVTGKPDFMSLKNWDLPTKSLLVNKTYKKYQIYYDLIGSEPKVGSSERLKNYIRSFDNVRKPLSHFDKDFANATGW